MLSCWNCSHLTPYFYGFNSFLLLHYTVTRPPFHHLSINLHFRSSCANPCGGFHVHLYWTEKKKFPSCCLPPILIVTWAPHSTLWKLRPPRALQCLHLPLSGFVPSVSILDAPSFSPSLHSRGHLIHDADDGNVAGAHVKIKSPSLPHTGKVITDYYGNGWQ